MGTIHPKLYSKLGFVLFKKKDKEAYSISKMINELCPDYFSQISPPLVLANNPHHRQRLNERHISQC